MEKEELEAFCFEAKLTMFELMENGKSGHIGGSLSVIELLSVIFENYINSSKNRLVYSKGHCEVALYSLLLQKNLIEDSYRTGLKQFGSKLQGHPCSKHIKNIEYSAGSLGQGLSFATGLAICGKEENYRVYCILGDGELQEGQVWEAALYAPRLHLDNLYVVVDCNGYQLEGETLSTGDTESMRNAWKSIGWDAAIIENGHDIASIERSFLKAEEKRKPHILFAKTVKGHGVSFMENNTDYHGINLSVQEIEQAVSELTEGRN